MHIRDFTQDDFAAATALWRLCGLHPSPSDTPARLAEISRRNPGLFLVALDAPLLAGTVMGSWDGRRGWINRLAVAPAQRRTGLGGGLLALVETRLRARGCDKVNLLIESDNETVAGFYAAAGYTRDPLIFMEKWL
jgi:ribosomal protein S18 acetylase RimI-like enzyme